MTRETCCLHQVFRSRILKIEVHGIGDCRICTSDKENKNCLRFCPVVINNFDVKEN